MDTASQERIIPHPSAWTNLVHSTAAAKPVDSPLSEVTQQIKDAGTTRLILICLGAASALLVGTALLGVGMEDSANARPFVKRTDAEKILASAGVLPERLASGANSIHSAIRAPHAEVNPSSMSTLTSIIASAAPSHVECVTNAVLTPVESVAMQVASKPVEQVPALPVPQTVRQRLDSMIAMGRYDDAIVFAYGEAPKLVGRENEMRRGELLTWLHANESSGKMPVLFTIARVHSSGENIESAAKWYMAASITGLIDASRCQDPAAAKAVSQLEEQFQDVRSYLRADAALRRNAVKFALEVEERLKDREPATWIAAHTTSSTGNVFVSDEEWAARRERYRKSLQGYLENR